MLSNKAIDLFNSIDAGTVKERRALYTPESGEYTLLLRRGDIEFDERGVEYQTDDGRTVVRPTIKTRFTILNAPNGVGAGEVFYDDRLELQSPDDPSWQRNENTKRALEAYKGTLGRWKANLATLTGKEVTSFGEALMEAVAGLPDDETAYVIEAHVRTSPPNKKGWRRVSVSFRRLLSKSRVDTVTA